MSSRVYPMSVGEPPSAAFTMTVDGAPTPLYSARVSKHPINRRWPGHQRPVEQTELASFALFEMDAPAQIVLKPSCPFHNVIVRPLSRAVHPRVEAGVISFTLPRAGAYTVELDGPHCALHLFADPVKRYGAGPRDENVLYYGKGIHDVGLIRLQSNQTLFLDEGAVVYARVEACDAHNIRILGHGILDGSRNHEKILFEFGDREIEQFNKGFAVENASRSHLVQLEYCDHVEIDGITLRDSPLYTIRPIACRDLRIEGVKIIGNWRYTSDGIDMHNCERVHIKDCFVRTYDDSICIKGFDYLQDEADMLHNGILHDTFRDVLVEGCVIWCDWGCSLEFGAETRAREICGVTFRDCDLIHNAAVALDVKNVDYADIHDVLFENIRVEYGAVSQRPMLQKSDLDVYAEDPDSDYMPGLFGAYILYIPEYSKDGTRRGRIRDVAFRNVAVSAPRMPPSEIHGYDAQHLCSNIAFENIRLNGRRLHDLAAAGIRQNAFAAGVHFS